MKKIIVLVGLAVMLIVGSLVGLAKAEERNSVCPECDLYTHKAVIPYLAVADGWWTGLAITNTTYDEVLCRIDYIGDYSVERFNVAQKSVFTFIADIKNTGYAVLRSTGAGYVSVMIGDENRLQGFCFDLLPILAPVIETEMILE